MTGRPGTACGEGPAVPLYVVTGADGDQDGMGGRDAKDGPLVLDLVTLVVARSSPAAGMRPEQAAIVRMCGRPLAMAEISAHLDLPFNAVSLLVAGLVADGHVTAHQTRSDQRRAAAETDLETLKALIDGLQRL